MTCYDITKQPQWVQQLVRKLESDAAYWKRKATSRANVETPLDLGEGMIGIGIGPELVERMPHESIVYFGVTGGYVAMSFSNSQLDGMSIDVRSQDFTNRLLIEPQTANSFKIRRYKR